MSLAIPDEVIERIAERAAELLAERQDRPSPSCSRSPRPLSICAASHNAFTTSQVKGDSST
jgi:hypothetical protein